MRGVLCSNDRQISPIERSVSLTARSCSYVIIIKKKKNLSMNATWIK